MAALTANVQRVRSAVDSGIKGDGEVAASTLIYKGSLVSKDANGRLITTKSTSNNCVGHAVKKLDNSSGAAGAISGEYLFGEQIEITSSSVTQGHIHRTLYAKDDNTVVPTATTGPAVGILMKLSGTTATVLLTTFEDKDGTG